MTLTGMSRKLTTTYKHLVIMLYVVIEGCSSLREVIAGLLADANKLGHLGLIMKLEITWPVYQAISNKLNETSGFTGQQ